MDKYLPKNKALSAIKMFLKNQHFLNGFDDCNIIGVIKGVKEAK